MSMVSGDEPKIGNTHFLNIIHLCLFHPDARLKECLCTRERSKQRYSTKQAG